MDSESPSVVFITGGAQGIGRGIARRFLAGGWRVAVLDTDAEALDELTRESGAGLEAIPGDAGQETDVRHALSQVGAAWGRLDAVVNNVGIGGPWNTPVEQVSLEDWNRTLAVNLTSIFLTAKHGVPWLRRSGRGSIVNLASTRAFQSEPHTEAYAATKGAVVALTHALAVSLGPVVRVNAVAPGWIEVGDQQKASRRRSPTHSEADRNQHPAGRVGTPDDIASAVWYLTSAEAGFLTGQTLVVDGGMARKMIYV